MYGSGSDESVSERATRFRQSRPSSQFRKTARRGLLPAQLFVRPAPWSAMVFPVVMLIAVLPGMAALNSWDLTPPGPMWGLRGLAVLDGFFLDQTAASGRIAQGAEAAAFRAVALQPPLYAWLEAIAFGLSSNRNPIASILPSYLAGALAVALVYLHGRLWCGTGVGLAAAILVGLNHNLLSRMQEATPATLVLCGVLAALLAYGWHDQANSKLGGAWRSAGPALTAIVGGFSLGVASLSLSGLPLIVIPIILLHQYYRRGFFRPSSHQNSALPWWPGRRLSPGFCEGLLALGVALAVSLPWFIFMFDSHGWELARALANPPYELSSGGHLSLLDRLIELAPVGLPLGLLGAVRAVRSALADEFDTRRNVGGSLWVIWLGLASLAPAVWPSGPQRAFDLVLLVPLHLLAAQTIADLVNRRLAIRSMIGLIPATAICIIWWASDDLGMTISSLIRGRASAATALGVHLALDTVVVSIVAVRALNRWAHRHDDRQRLVLIASLLFILIASVGTGFKEVVFRHSETHDLLSLRTMVLRLDRDRPFNDLTVVSSNWSSPERDRSGPESNRPLPGGRLRFILRTALPRLGQRDLNRIDDLFALPEGRRLIVLAGTEHRLSSFDQLKLGVEAIHPGRSGILDAYATARGRQPHH
jgi:Dolichyl-phosphate-mannose-protein mannosyltransferase